MDLTNHFPPLQVPSNGSPASYIDQSQREKALQSMQQMSSAQIVSASAMHQKSLISPHAAAAAGIHHPPVTYGGNFWQPAIHAGMPQE